MSVTLQLELLLGSVCLLAVIFYMLKKNLLSVKYSLLWLFFAAALILFAAVPYVVYVLRDILNIEIPVNLVFVLLFCFVLLVLLSVQRGKQRRPARPQSVRLSVERRPSKK